jgi:hypothetical protein
VRQPGETGIFFTPEFDMRKVLLAIVCFFCVSACCHGDDVRVRVRESRPGLFERMRASRPVYPVGVIATPSSSPNVAALPAVPTLLLGAPVAPPAAEPKQLRILIEKK